MKYHVMPLDDLRDHVTSDTCWCCPSEPEDDDVVVHHAMDQRELYESGELRLQ